jgi:O-antigen/teichoic acid export membrane protein
LLWILATPFLIHRLGAGQYGLWSFGIALIGTVSFLQVGIGDAVTKFVSEDHGRGDSDRIHLLIRTTLTTYALLGFLVVIAGFATAPSLAHRMSFLKSGNEITYTWVVRLASIGICFRFIEAVFYAALRGFARYDVILRIGIGIKIATVAAAVGVVAMGEGAVGVLGITVAVTGLGTLIAGVTWYSIGGGFDLVPTLHRESLRRVFGFGVYSWVQGLGGMMFNQMDRLLIGATLGAAPLAYYTICVQLAQQVHGITAAGFNFIFPVMSTSLARGERTGLRETYRYGSWANIAVGTLLALPLILFSGWILTIWVGPQVAARASMILAILAITYLILAVNVVPHNALLALGRVRFVSFMNLAGGALSLLLMAVLIPPMGLAGAALGRLAYGPIISVNRFQVTRMLENFPT